MVRTSGYGRARSSARDIDCTYSGAGMGDRILMEERIYPSAAFALFSVSIGCWIRILPGVHFHFLGASLFWGVGFTSYSAFMGHLGTDATAANSVAAVVRDLICCFSGGISSAGGIMVGNELGAGNLARGREYGDRLVRFPFCVELQRQS